jgi:hypothetical protein
MIKFIGILVLIRVDHVIKANYFGLDSIMLMHSKERLLVQVQSDPLNLKVLTPVWSQSLLRT